MSAIRLFRLAAPVLLSISAVGLVSWYMLLPNSTLVGARDSQSDPDKKAALPMAMQFNAGSDMSTTLPPSLRDRPLSRLPVDAQGYMVSSPQVVEYFQQYLIARGELGSDAALDALVRQQITTQLRGLPAKDDALAIWSAYRRYLVALADEPDQSVADGGTPEATLEAQVKRKIQLQTKYLGDWAAGLFGESDRVQMVMAGVMKIESRQDLGEAEKKRQLDLLYASNNYVPPITAGVDSIARMKSAGLSSEAVRANIEQVFGEASVKRYDELNREDQAWTDRYQAYSQSRNVLMTQGLSADEQNAQLEQLRSSYFGNSADAARAAALDRIEKAKLAGR
ncbi:lipase secretion chaperone [Paraburkholderia xenovorans]|uniref:lipase secretion chaperone n=1 Tax=Paraburkholderia xenovorans TaxID=36873 RepID=UPI0038BD1D31